MTSFIALTVVEMRRALHRRLVRWMIVLALASCVLTGVIAFFSRVDPADEHPAKMASWWIAGTGDGFLLVAALFLVFGAAICGASVAGAEWRAGTITTVLTWEPRRRRLHAARTLSAAVLSFAIGIVLQIVFLGSTVPAVVAHGNTDGVDAEFWRSLLLGMVRIGLMTTLVATLAVSIATLGRNTSAALVVLAAWAMVVERIIAGLRPQWARFLVGENVAIVVPWTPLSDAEFDRPPIVALTWLIVCLAVVVVAATSSFARRDIAASS